MITINTTRSANGELLHFGAFADQHLEDTDANVLEAVQIVANFLKPYAGRMIYLRKPLTITRGQKSFEGDKTYALVNIRGTILLGETEEDVSKIPWQDRYTEINGG